MGGFCSRSLRAIFAAFAGNLSRKERGRFRKGRKAKAYNLTDQFSYGLKNSIF